MARFHERPPRKGMQCAGAACAENRLGSSWSFQQTFLWIAGTTTRRFLKTSRGRVITSRTAQWESWTEYDFVYSSQHKAKAHQGAIREGGTNFPKKKRKELKQSPTGKNKALTS